MKPVKPPAPQTKPGYFATGNADKEPAEKFFWANAFVIICCLITLLFLVWVVASQV
jgi:hypothetical protein